MSWVSLKLWADVEEKRIHECLINALHAFISARVASPSDDERVLSGKLRPFLYAERKRLRLAATIQPEASSFADIRAPFPSAYPDVRFLFNTPENDQYEYDVEAKIVRTHRPRKSHDYCRYYVTGGILRFQHGTYARSIPPMGAMIGYAEKGKFSVLLTAVNSEAVRHSLEELASLGTPVHPDVHHFEQTLGRAEGTLRLTHFWADL